MIFYLAKWRVDIKEECSVDVVASHFAKMSLIPAVQREREKKETASHFVGYFFGMEMGKRWSGQEWGASTNVQV